MARYASVDQLLARYPTLSAGKDRGELASILTQASGDVDQHCDRSFNLRYRAELLPVSGPGTPGAIGPRSQWYYTTTAEGWLLDSARPATFFLRHWPILEIDTIDIIYPTGDMQRISVDRITQSEEGWVQLPAGLYMPVKCQLRVTYWHGYPSPVLTANATQGDLTLQVDNMRGLSVAQILTSLDGENGEEVQLAFTPPVALPIPLPPNMSAYAMELFLLEQQPAWPSNIAAVVPGTITLIEPLTSFHAQGTMFSALPTNLVRATLLLAADSMEQDNRPDPKTFGQGVTLVRSGDMEMRRQNDRQGSSSGTGDLAQRAYSLLERYKRSGVV